MQTGQIKRRNLKNNVFLVKPSPAAALLELECIFEVLSWTGDCASRVIHLLALHFGSFHHFHCLTQMSATLLSRMDSGVVAAKAAVVSSRVMGHWWLLREMASLLGIVETVFDAFLGGLQIRNKTWAACGHG